MQSFPVEMIGIKKRDEQLKEDFKAVVDEDDGDDDAAEFVEDATVGNSGAEFLAGLPGRRKWNDESEVRRSAMSGRSNEDDGEGQLGLSAEHIGAQ